MEDLKCLHVCMSAWLKQTFLNAVLTSGFCHFKSKWVSYTTGRFMTADVRNSRREIFRRQTNLDPPKANRGDGPDKRPHDRGRTAKEVLSLGGGAQHFAMPDGAAQKKKWKPPILRSQGRALIGGGAIGKSLVVWRRKCRKMASDSFWLFQRELQEFWSIFNEIQVPARFA